MDIHVLRIHVYNYHEQIGTFLFFDDSPSQLESYLLNISLVILNVYSNLYFLWLSTLLAKEMSTLKLDCD